MKHERIFTSSQQRSHHRNGLTHRNISLLKLPYELSVDRRSLTIQQWLSNLDAIIDDCNHDHHQHPSNKHPRREDKVSSQDEDDSTVNERKHSLDHNMINEATSQPPEEEDVTVVTPPPPRRKRQRRNSFVIHHDGHGHSMSLLGEDFQAFLQEENAKDEKGPEE